MKLLLIAAFLCLRAASNRLFGCVCSVQKSKFHYSSANNPFFLTNSKGEVFAITYRSACAQFYRSFVSFSNLYYATRRANNAYASHDSFLHSHNLFILVNQINIITSLERCADEKNEVSLTSRCLFFISFTAVLKITSLKRLASVRTLWLFLRATYATRRSKRSKLERIDAAEMRLFHACEFLL